MRLQDRKKAKHIVFRNAGEVSKRQAFMRDMMAVCEHGIISTIVRYLQHELRLYVILLQGTVRMG